LLLAHSPPSHSLPRCIATRGASSLKVPHQANSHAAGPIIRGEMIAVVGPHICGAAEPRAAAQLVIGAIAVGARGSVDGCADIIRAPAVSGPLKDIAQHVVESKGVALERTDGGRVDVAILAAEYRPARIPMDCALVGDVAVLTRTGPVGIPRQAGCPARACRIFPFGSAGQSVEMTGLQRQPRCIGHRIVPGSTGDRMLSGLGKSRALPTVLRAKLPRSVVGVAALHIPSCRRDELLELIHRDRIGRHGQRTVDHHPVQRLFKR